MWKRERKVICRTAVTAVLAAGMILGTNPVWAANVQDGQGYTQFQPIEGNSVYEKPNLENMKKNLEALCGATGIGPHSMGTPEEKQAAQYIAGQLQTYSDKLRVTLLEQPFAGTTQEKRKTELGVIHIAGERNMYGKYLGPGKEENFKADAPVVFCDSLDGITDEMAGKIVLLDREAGNQSIRDATEKENAAITAAAEKGVAGLIFSSVTKGSKSGATREMSQGRVETKIPAMVVQKEYGDILKGYLSGTLDKEISVERYTVDKTYTVEAVLPAKSQEPDAIMYVTAHFDSVVGGPGTNDNGSGTVGAMELARIYSKTQSNVEIRFLFVGGEESGLVGSRLYTQNLSQKEIDKSLCVLNMDEIASTHPDWNRLSVEVVDGKMNLSAALMLNSAGELKGQISPDTHYRIYKFGSTDHQSFHDIGVDAAGLFRGDTVENSEPVNHTYDDTIEGNMDWNRLMDGISIVSKAAAAVIDAEPDKFVDYTVTKGTKKNVLSINNIDGLTGLSDKVVAEMKDPDGQVSEITLSEANKEHQIDLSKTGEYEIHFYSVGRGVTDWGDWSSDKKFPDASYAEAEYTIDLGTYKVNAELISLNTAELSQFIDKVKDTNPSEYTEESWAAFKEALTKAQNSLSAATTQVEIDEALNSLKGAHEALKLLPEPADQWIKDEKGWKYQLKDGSFYADGWAQIDGKWYYFDDDGYMDTGWLKEDGKFYYLNKDGSMATGWLTIGTRTYYLNDKGERQTGWVTIEGKEYYFDNNGVLDKNKKKTSASSTTKKTTSTKKKTASGAKTGDETPIAAVMLLFAGSGAAVLASKNRKKKA